MTEKERYASIFCMDTVDLIDNAGICMKDQTQEKRINLIRKNNTEQTKKITIDKSL